MFKVRTPSDLVEKYGDRLADLAVGYHFRGRSMGFVEEEPVWNMPGDRLSELYAKTLHDT